MERRRFLVGSTLSLYLLEIDWKGDFDRAWLAILGLPSLSTSQVFSGFVGCFILFSDTYFNGSNNIFINSIFTNIVKLFVIGISIAILYVSHGYIKNNKLNLFEYPILLLFSVLGMLVMLSSNDLLLLYVSIELHEQDRSAQEEDDSSTELREQKRAAPNCVHNTSTM